MFQTPMKRATLTAMLALAVVLPATAQAQLAETPIAQEHGGTLVATYGGWLVWSSYDQSSESWSLVGRAPGSSSIQGLQLASRPIPFDVDLGPDSSGRTVAVYSRCQIEPVARGQTFASYWHRFGRDCRIVKLDLGTGRESTLYRRSGASLIYPTLWRDRLAYVVRGRLPDDLHLEQRVRRDGRTVTTKLGRAPAEETESPYAGPLRLDLYGKNLVFAWQTEVGRCRGPSATDDGRGPFFVSRVYLQRGNLPRRLLDKGCSEDGRTGAVASVDAVTVSDGVVNWVRGTRSDGPEGATYLRRQSLRTGRSTSRVVPSRYTSLAADGRTVYAQADAFRIVAVRVG
ncbi:MAG: hypothetical protein H0T43_09465 [Solirubrobacterales bacterium]|nr:hypothetical protein [Solirubrobacterales bacterium]